MVSRSARSAGELNTARLLEEARAGNSHAREHLLSRLVPFVMRTAARVTGRPVDRERDDEASIALIGLNEAIDSYDGKSASFLSFSQLVIRRRLIDHFRREQATGKAWPIGDSTEVGVVQIREALSRHLDDMVAEECRDEIERFQRALAAFGLSLEAVARACPRHSKARQRAQRAARLLAADEDLSRRLQRDRKLPIRELAALTGAHRRTLQRQRRYIIAVFIILTGDFAHMSDYVGGNLDQVRGGIR